MERALDLLGRPGVPSSPPSDDCVVFVSCQSTELSKGHMNTTHDDAADPAPSLMCTNGPAIAALCERFLLRERVLTSRAGIVSTCGHRCKTVVVLLLDLAALQPCPFSSALQ